VWISVTNNPANAERHGTDVSGTSTTLTGLINGTTYYIWVKTKNHVGTSEFSHAVSGKPLGTPGLPTISSPVYKQLLISWTAVAGADEYEVYYGTDMTTTLATTTSETTIVITGLIDGTTYNIRLRAKNSTGVSDYGPSASSVIRRSPGLYRNNTKIGDQNLGEALSYISTNAVSGDDFYIVLGANESASPINLNYSGKTVGITLLGYDVERTITLNSNGNMFTINSGVTLTIDENISLIGMNTNNTALVRVNSNGTFTMNGGTISGNTAVTANSWIDGGGGGIYVNYGSVTMNGGTISGNTVNSTNSTGCGGGIYVSNGTVIMNGGTISGNNVNSTNGTGYGGGIFVSSYGTVTMNGGTISGNNAPSSGGGIYVISFGTVTMYGGTISGNSTLNWGGGIYVSGGTFKKLPPNGEGQNSGIIYGSGEAGVDADGVVLRNTAYGSGAAVYYSSSWQRNTTAGQTDYIDTETGMGF